MKKFLGWLSLVLIAIFPLSVFAESVPLNTFSKTHHWKQTYNAHNRSIEIDIEIAIPEEMEAAILTVRDGDSSLTDEQLARYAAIEGWASIIHSQCYQAKKTVDARHGCLI